MGALELNFQRLNKPQLAAVFYDGGPLLVLAGAGSGKTQVIMYRIARLLRDGVSPSKILAVTFTNKAAKEMRQRLQQLIGRAASKVSMLTFHALGLMILREEGEVVGLHKKFCIYDKADCLSLVRELMRQIKVADRRLDPERVLDVILRAKKERLSEVPLLWGDDYELAAFDLYQRYLEQMRVFNAVDFDDLLLKAQDVLRDPAAKARLASKFSHVLVDEYQDTSGEQVDILKSLIGIDGNVCAVGDDDQSIYAWRGAVANNILLFNQHFKGVHEIVLDQNYRSTQNILTTANSLILNNKMRKVKVLWSDKGAGEQVKIVACLDDTDEANFVTQEINRLIFTGVKPQDIAILYRSNIQSRTFEESLALENIPFKVIGGQAFFDCKEVRDALAFLSLVCYPHHELALRRIINVPPRGLGPVAVDKLANYALNHKTSLYGALKQISLITEMTKAASTSATKLVEFLEKYRQAFKEAPFTLARELAEKLFTELALREHILNSDDAASLKERRLDNLGYILNQLGRLSATFIDKSEDATSLKSATDLVEEFLKLTSLQTQIDSEPENPLDKENSAVNLITLHSAKGLEFAYVFLVGVEEDLLPHKHSLEEQTEASLVKGHNALAEERRLCYVGITRAKQNLWITHAKKRALRGKPSERTPSRFLQEIEHALQQDQGAYACIYDREFTPFGPSGSKGHEFMAQEFFKQMHAQLGIE